MKGDFGSRLAFLLAFVAAVAAVGAVVWRAGYVQALDQLARRGEADLALSSDRVTGQLQRYRELAVLMADHPVVAGLIRGDDPQAASELFEAVADKTSALEVAFIDSAGRIRAAARGPAGREVVQTGYLHRAMTGALGTGHGTDLLMPGRAFYFAAPHFGPDGLVHGAVIVAADVAELELNWTGSNPAVFITDANGLVFITNRPELTFWRHGPGLGLAPQDGPVPPLRARVVAGHEIWELDWGPYLPARALHIARDLPVIELRSEALVSIAPALRIAWLQAAAVMALCLAFGALLFLATERRRTLAQANARLEARVAARTQELSASNAALRREVAEREEAEAALRQAQADLVQAGKLSALGQMSAGISHELNQPLMAIGSYAENAAAFLRRGKPERAGENLGRISEMAQRMGRIIRNLRAFARQESAPVARVDLVRVLGSAVELVQTHLDDAGVTLVYDPPDGPLWVRGGEVRLGQVFVNLMTNAADAMAASAVRELRVEVAPGPPLSVRVSDTGPGIDMPDKVFEPFYSTKTGSAEAGMGLGLSISYGIVQSFGGTIRGANLDGGGAVFTVELEPWAAEDVAA